MSSPAHTGRRDRERHYAREHMRRLRAEARDLHIPRDRINWRRRRIAERDPRQWLTTYLRPLFYHPFSRAQDRLLTEGLAILRHGGRRAVALERGGGKSTLCKGLISYAIVTGLIHFLVLVAKSGSEADQRGRELREIWERPEYADLQNDYPCIAVPIQALGGTSKGASTQTCNGVRTFIEWPATGRFAFPCIEGSVASGAIVHPVGIEGSIRGQVAGDRRPDAVLLDDVESLESVRSELLTDRIRTAFDQDIEGLSGPGGRMSIFYICTIAKQGCIADEFTDSQRRPAWHGLRCPAVLRWPDREDLWEHYLDLRRRDALTGDTTGRTAHAYLLAHERDMHAGAVLNNEHNYDHGLADDGTQLQISNLQWAYDKIADTSRDAFFAEYQAEPPAETAPETIPLSDTLICSRVNGLPRGHCPPDTDGVFAAVDLGGHACHWVVLAACPGRLHIIDYGAQHVLSPQDGPLTSPANRPMTQRAIVDALRAIKARFDEGFLDPDTGEVVPVQGVGVDTRWQASRKNATGPAERPVFEFLRDECSPRVWHAVNGLGATEYRRPSSGHGKTVGEGWYRVLVPTWRLRMTYIDTDHWKFLVHDRLAMNPETDGAMLLFGRDPGEHGNYARQIQAEEYRTQWDPKKGLVSRWVPLRRDNHYLDATAYALAVWQILCGPASRRRPTISPTAPHRPQPPRRAALPAADAIQRNTPHTTQRTIGGMIR